MKVCPFCREEVRDEAIKCRYCASVFSPGAEGDQNNKIAGLAFDVPRIAYVPEKHLVRQAQILGITLVLFLGTALVLYAYEIRQAGRIAARPSPASAGPAAPSTNALATPGPNQVNFIVDQDLVRFGKFAGAVLAIFVTVGLFLYGFDIKQSAKEVRDSADSMRQIRYDIGKAKDEVTADRERSRKLLEETQESLTALKEQANGIQAAQNDIQAAQESTKKMVADVDANRKQLEASLADFQTRVDGELKQMEAFRAQAEKGASSILEKEKEVTTFVSRIMSVSAPGPETGQADKEKAREDFTVPELARLYEFPGELDGRGQCIGLIELAGGYRKSDLQAYFHGLKLSMPKVTDFSVDGTTNSPTRGGGGADGQVTLNIEVAGAAAPGAHIVVYFAPNTNQGFLDAINAAIGDKKNQPAVLVICWGAPESNWTKQAMTQMDRAFRTAANQNMTILAAAGDSGASDGVKDGRAHVDFPASSPWVLACGGTRIKASGNRLISETVWNDTEPDAQWPRATGGGISSVFPLPDWQAGANVPAGREGRPGRGLPDVAANASVQSGYRAILGGRKTVMGGTAAVTPFVAGLIALMNQALGRNLGFINPLLYSKLGPSGVLRSISEGNNSTPGVQGYSAGPGWNACSGWGSPNGKKLLEALRTHFNGPQ